MPPIVVRAAVQTAALQGSRTCGYVCMTYTSRDNHGSGPLDDSFLYTQTGGLLSRSISPKRLVAHQVAQGSPKSLDSPGSMVLVHWWNFVTARDRQVSVQPRLLEPPETLWRESPEVC